MRTLLISCALLSAATMAGARSDDAQTQIDALRAQIETQRQEIARLRAALAAANAADETAAPADGAVWSIAVRRSPDDPRAPLGPTLAEYAGSDDLLTLGEAAEAAGAPAAALTVQRSGAFIAKSEGFHGLGVEIGFPDIGVAGYLGGFICEAEMTIDGAQAFRRTLRRPYGRRDARANVTSTERLAPGRYAVVQTVSCRADGRHGADAEPALQRLTLRSLVRRPNERSAHPAAAGDFAAR